MKRFSNYIIVLVLSLAVGRRSAAADVAVAATADTVENRSAPHLRVDGGADTGRFRLLSADQTGIDFAHVWDPRTDRHEELTDKAVVGGRVAVGAREMVEYDDSHVDVAEIRSGAGYLSQGPRQVTFHSGTTRRAVRVHVRWPDGERTSQEISSSDGPIVEVRRD